MRKKIIAFMLATTTTFGAMAMTATTAKADVPNNFDLYGKSIWVSDFNKGWKYQLPNMTMAKGWVKDKGNWYYLGSDCYMKTGWQLINGYWYYLDNNGVMQTGWKFINGQWYSLNNSGAMETGWKLENGQWFYLNNSGEMARGWAQVNKKWYFFNPSGVMQTGWVSNNGSWYYLRSDGSMTTGWQCINDFWYYMNNSGSMLNHGNIDGWDINNDGTATVSIQKAKDILKSKLGNKAKYIEYRSLEKGGLKKYDSFRFYASDKPINKNDNNILNLYSVRKYTALVAQG